MQIKATMENGFVPTGITPQQIMAVYKAIGAFISLTFKKAKPDLTVMADIGVFGGAIRNSVQSSPQASMPLQDFYPSSLLLTELPFKKKNPQIDLRKEISIERLALVTQLNKETLSTILM